MPYLSIIPTPYHPSLQRGHSVGSSGGGGGGGNVSPIARPFNYYRRTKSDIQGKIKAIVEKMTQNINYNAIQTPKVVEIKNDHDDDDDTESNYGDDDHDDDYTEPATLRAGLCSPACYAEFTVNPYSIADHITFGDALSVLEKVKVEIASGSGSGSGSCWCYSKKRENIVTTITAIPQPQDHEKTPRRSLGLGAACDDVLREKWESLGIFRALYS